MQDPRSRRTYRGSWKVHGICKGSERLECPCQWFQASLKLHLSIWLTAQGYDCRASCSQSRKPRGNWTGRQRRGMLPFDCSSWSLCCRTQSSMMLWPSLSLMHDPSLLWTHWLAISNSSGGSSAWSCSLRLTNLGQICNQWRTHQSSPSDC